MNNATQPVKTWQEREQLLAGHGELFRSLLAVLAEYFREESQGKEYPRRPRLSIKLAVAGEPPARLAITPGWNRTHQRVCPAHARLELLVARLPDRKSSAELAVFIGENYVRLGLWSRVWGEEGIARMTTTLRAFLDQPVAVFARSSER